ncbi:HIT domain-containing protein [Enterobacteriaceae endosymbiont of Donacia bicoloricornis]|uniref:histidine triad nucleotide-binding protein n=1 Tax=Enterobacteriaceae endosymbiont of Donacia bicoloricornis TaxID=2675772 RepID=UPI00144935FC|nr:histidine triad nucleotide-binding protein [Enterobacteriaceae endosymbiont of Donacia bicoloricornis]QJC37628.1 HIT domain-containing protein [Enterobacteriaceae endosymbiont of Donacia bicoloricornis]
MNNKKNIFQQILSKEIVTDFIYQDDLITAFNDIKPQSPIHVLIIPNFFIKTLNNVNYKHELVLGRMLLVASKIAKKKNIDKSGYRIVINCNNDGCQTIFYLHMHLLGGRKGNNIFF